MSKNYGHTHELDFQEREKYLTETEIEYPVLVRLEEKFVTRPDGERIECSFQTYELLFKDGSFISCGIDNRKNPLEMYSFIFGSRRIENEFNEKNRILRLLNSGRKISVEEFEMMSNKILDKFNEILYGIKQDKKIENNNDLPF